MAKRSSCVPRCSRSRTTLKPIKKWLSPCMRSWRGKSDSPSLCCCSSPREAHLLTGFFSFSFTHDIEALSCDEVLIDGSALLAELGIGPEDLAKAIRADIKEKTGCCASVGMGEFVSILCCEINLLTFGLYKFNLTARCRLRVQHPPGSSGDPTGQTRRTVLPQV